MHVNIRSIPAILNNFLSYMSNIDHSFSVIGFSETWLTPANIDAYSTVGYNHVGLTRDERKAGGVSLLIYLKNSHHSCYIMGDYNLDLLKHDKHPLTENFLDVIYAHSFIPVINRPTRVTMNTFTLIDNIFTNHHDVKEHQLHGILKTDITDHFPLFHINRGKKAKMSLMMNINSSE